MSVVFGAGEAYVYLGAEAFSVRVPDRDPDSLTIREHIRTPIVPRVAISVAVQSGRQPNVACLNDHAIAHGDEQDRC